MLVIDTSSDIDDIRTRPASAVPCRAGQRRLNGVER